MGGTSPVQAVVILAATSLTILTAYSMLNLAHDSEQLVSSICDLISSSARLFIVSTNLRTMFRRSAAEVFFHPWNAVAADSADLMAASVSAERARKRFCSLIAENTGKVAPVLDCAGAPPIQSGTISSPVSRSTVVGMIAILMSTHVSKGGCKRSSALSVYFRSGFQNQPPVWRSDPKGAALRPAPTAVAVRVTKTYAICRWNLPRRYACPKPMIFGWKNANG